MQRNRDAEKDFQEFASGMFGNKKQKTDEVVEEVPQTSVEQADVTI